jgi:hypothetical protein
MNFQVRDLVNVGDALLEAYLQELFTFTLDSFRVPSHSFKFHSSQLTQLWQRIMQESNYIKTACQGKVEEIIDQIIATYLEENIKQEGLSVRGPIGGLGANLDDGLNGNEEDEDENFQKREKTMRQENLDYFSRLMKQKTERSVQMILSLFNNLLVQYE